MVAVIGTFARCIHVASNDPSFGTELVRWLHQSHNSTANIFIWRVVVRFTLAQDIPTSTINLHQIEVRWIAGRFRTWITDVALNIELFGQCHCCMGSNTQAGTTRSHQLDRVQGQRTRFHLFLLRYTLDTRQTNYR